MQKITHFSQLIISSNTSCVESVAAETTSILSSKALTYLVCSSAESRQVASITGKCNSRAPSFRLAFKYCFDRHTAISTDKIAWPLTSSDWVYLYQCRLVSISVHYMSACFWNCKPITVLAKFCRCHYWVGHHDNWLSCWNGNHMKW